MHEQLTPQFAFALSAFLLDAEARQLRTATIRFYQQQIGYFLGFLVENGFATTDDITAHVVRAYLAGLQTRGLAPSSVQAAARAIRAFCSFLVAEEVIATSPMKRVKLPKADRRKPDAFTPEEVRRLLKAANCVRDRAIILCLLDTGCRAGEFVAWNVGDVNVMTGTVRVVQTKNGAERTVYLGMKARQALLKHLAQLPCRAPEAPLWADMQTLLCLQPSGLHQLLERTGRRADVLPCGPHKFRRTFATCSLRNDMNIYDLKTLMGHSGLEMLLRYLDTDASAAHQQYGAVDRTLGRIIQTSTSPKQIQLACLDRASGRPSQKAVAILSRWAIASSRMQARRTHRGSSPLLDGMDKIAAPSPIGPNREIGNTERFDLACGRPKRAGPCHVEWRLFWKPRERPAQGRA